MNDKNELAMPLAKIIAAWAAIGITDWQGASFFFATLLSIAMLADWFWKRFWRPLFEHLGWLKPKNRKYTRREWAEMIAQQDTDQAPLS